MSDQVLITLAASYTTNTETKLRFSPPETWEDFDNTVTRELIPFDFNQSSIKRLRGLQQSFSVSAYLAEPYDAFIKTFKIQEEGNVGRFCRFIKSQKR